MIVWLAVAGSGGALCRFLLDGYIRHRWPARFPWATLIVNVSGSLLLGIITGLVLYRQASPDLDMIVGTGFCGGYTTFSTTTFETVRLVQQRRFAAALGNGLVTTLVTLGAAALGLVVVR